MESGVLVLSLSGLLALVASLPGQGSSANWSAIAPTTPDADFTIPANTTVYLNVANPLRVKTLKLEQGSGTTPGARLVFDPIAVHLSCHQIIVEAQASFEVGSATAPASGPVVITLHSIPDPNQTGKHLRGEFLVKPGGTLELHGDPRGVDACWTELEEGASAKRNDLTVRVRPVLPWQPDDRIVIAATDFQKVVTLGNPDVMHDQTEEFVLTSVTQTGNGQVLGIQGDLAYDHSGVTVADTVQERAEVGLLNRSIRIEGDGPQSVPGHVMLGDFGSWRVAATAHIEWTEFTNLGGIHHDGDQKPVFDFYPLHFHRLGVVSGSYVKCCSLHHNFNNNLVIHTTDNLLVDGNVLYDTVGWHVWLQTSINGNAHVPTSNNVITNNLALLARDNGTLEAQAPFTSKLDSAACFYITSFDNDIRGNRAGSSEGSGFYCDTIETKNAGAWKTWSKDHPFPTFQDNVGHSCGDHGFYLDGFTEFPRVDPKDTSGPPWAKFHRFTGYKNNGFGFHCRNFGGVEWIDTQLADNGAGLYLASVGYWLEEYAAIGVLSGGKIVGESPDNLGLLLTNAEIAYGRSLPSRRDHSTFFHIAGNPAQLCEPELTGVSMYDGLVHVEGVEFRGFEESSSHTTYRGHSGAFSPAAYPNPWAVDSRNMAKSCTFVTWPASPSIAVNRVWFREYVLYPAYPNGANHVILNDMDGSILGPSSGGGGVVFPDANTLMNEVVPTGQNPDWNSSYKHSAHPFGQVVLFHFTLNAFSTVSFGNGQVTLGPKLIPDIYTPSSTSNLHDYHVYMHPWNTSVSAHPNLPGQRNVMSFGGSNVPGRMTLLWTGNASGSIADFEIPYDPGHAAALSVVAAESYDKAKAGVGQAGVLMASLAAWQAYVPTVGQKAAFFYDAAAMRLYLRVMLPGFAPSQQIGAYKRGGIFSGQPVYVCVQ